MFPERHHSAADQHPVVTAAVWILIGFTSVGPVGTTTVRGDDEFPRSEVIDWTSWRTSPIDLVLNETDVLRHRHPLFDDDERTFLESFLEQIDDRRRMVRQMHPGRSAAVWEDAFYRFSELRRAAWEAGSLTIRGMAAVAGPPDPFRDRDDPDTSPGPVLNRYSLTADIRSHPEHFVGRPVVFRGLLRRESSDSDRSRTAVLQTSDRAAIRSLTFGELFPLDDADAPSLAMVCTSGVEFADDDGIRSWPGRLMTLPVLVKGWVVKLWDHRPLIYCEAVREISVHPHRHLIRRHTVSERRLLDEESWIFYETLQGLQDWDRFLQSGFPSARRAPSHRRAADAFLKQRLDTLRRDMAAKAVEEEARLKKQFDSGHLTALQFHQEQWRLNRLWQLRDRRYRDAVQDPGRFDTFVDLFMNPDAWQGRLVTLRGHVRHVMSYPADHPSFSGRRLHELWLFTADSQNNPAVIVSTHVPEEFPTEADIIDHVTVTGCVFKRYVYRSQDASRIAPLILTDHVTWTPDTNEILELAAEGHLPAGSVLVRQAQRGVSDRQSGLALLLVSSGAVLAVVILWGQSERERRQRRHLFRRMAGEPQFESFVEDQYAARPSDYTAGYDV